MDNLPLYKQPRFRLAIYLAVLISIPLIFFLLKPIFTQIPGSCLILEERYCKGVQLIKDPNIDGGLLAAYNIPKNTVLFSPVDGAYSDTPTFFFKEKTNSSSAYIKYPGANIVISQDSRANTVSAIYSFIYFADTKNSNLKNIKKSEIISKISDRKIDFLGDFNLIVKVTKQKFTDGKIKSEDDREQLKRMLKIK